MKKKIRIIYLGFIILNFQLITHNSFSQNVSINSDGSSGSSNTMLEIKSTDNTSSTYGLKVKDSGGNDNMVVRSDGDVGIGITVPTAKLHVEDGNVRVKRSGVLASQDVNAIMLNWDWSNSTSAASAFVSSSDASATNPGLTDAARWQVYNGSAWYVPLIAYKNSDIGLGAGGGGTNSRIFIESGGEVGIGTTTPQKQLEVVSSVFDIAKLRRTGASGGAGIQFENTSAQTWSIGGGSDGNFYLFETGVGLDTRLFVERTSGEVGIGTITPSAPLHISANSDDLGSTAGFIILQDEDPTATSETATIEWQNSTGSTLGKLFVQGASGTTGGFMFQNSTGNTNVKFLENGKVGIGNTSPTGYLEVYSGQTGSRQITTNGWADMSSGAAGYGAFMGNSYYDYDGSTNDWYYSNTHASIGAIGFAVNYPSWNKASVITSGTTSSTQGAKYTPSTIMTFLNTGEVGIGTTSPSTSMHIASATARMLKLERTGAGGSFMHFVNAPGHEQQMGLGNDNVFSIYNAASGTPGTTRAININTSGNVGIRTTAPTAVLSVNGAANNTTGVWGVFSDQRIKSIDGEFTDGLEIIKNINPIRFHYNEDAPFYSDKEQIGIVAQELEKIAPYMVTTTKSEKISDLREVNPQAYIFLLINSIKEQQQIIDRQKDKIGTLESDFSSLESSLRKENQELRLRMNQLEEYLKTTNK